MIKKCCKPDCERQRTSTSYCTECFTEYKRELRAKKKKNITEFDIYLQELDEILQKMRELL